MRKMAILSRFYISYQETRNLMKNECVNAENWYTKDIDEIYILS